VDFVKTIESSGVDYITVHGRRRTQRSSEPVNLSAINLIKSTATVPVTANGDVFTLADVDAIVAATNVDGVMAARGLLENPGLFAGHAKTPWGAVERFLHYNLEYGPLPFALALYHIGEMLRHIMTKRERAEMTRSAGCMVELLDWLDERVVVRRFGEEAFGKRVEMERV
jgi:tRNA-dihydrouridine synthase 4